MNNNPGTSARTSLTGLACCFVAVPMIVFTGSFLLVAVARCADELEPRTISGTTRLADAEITVSAPSGFPKTLLKEINEALAERGAKVRVAAGDADVVDALRAGPVLAIGHGWNNDVIRRLYYECFDWTDAAWPSRGGYALRTIVDPYATGHDVIRIAYSVDTDAEQAIRAFLRILERTPQDKALGHLHVVKLGELEPVYARYLDPLLSHDFRWRHEDNTWDLQVQISHLGVGYLQTGREQFLTEFRSRFLRYLKHNSARGWGGSHGFMHHITLPYFLTEHHPVWSPDDRRTAVRLIREVFLSGDGIRWGGFVAGTKGPYPRDNHATRAALDNFFHARYLARYHKLPEAKQGLELVDRFFRWQFSCAKPAEDSNGHQFKASMINTMSYALAIGDRTMIDSGTLQRAADRAQAQMNNRGFGALFSGPGASGFSPVTLLSMAAVAYDDPCYYRTVALGEPDEGKTGKVPLAALVMPHRYGDEFLRAFAMEAKKGTGPICAKHPSGRSGKLDLSPFSLEESALSVAAFDEAYRGVVPEVPETGFDKLWFRGGFTRRAEYLLLDGMSGGHHAYENANCVLEMGVEGYTWICAVDGGYGDASVRNQNGVQVLLDGLASPGRPRFAERLGSVRSGDMTIVATLLDDPSRRCPWRRWVVHRRGQWFAIFDDVSLPARPANELAAVQARWFLHGNVNVTDRSLLSRQGTEGEQSWLCATVIGEGAVATEPVDLSLSYWAWREACGKWLFQDITFRDDFPIDRAATPATATKLTISQAVTGGAPRRVVGGLLLTWGRGEGRVPSVTTSSAGTFSAKQPGLQLAASFDAKGLTVRSQDEVARLDLPEARRVGEPLLGGKTTVPAVPPASKEEQHHRYLEVPADHLPAGTPLALREVDGAFVVATDGNEVVAVRSDGRLLWNRQSQAGARRIASLRTDDETLTLLGDDAGKVTAVAADGTLRWQTQLPFSETVYTLSWTHGRSMVRALVTGDLDTDGRNEVVVGVTDNHLYCLDDEGNTRWRRQAQWGTPATVRLADLNGDGKREVLFGTDDPSIHGSCLVCNHEGGYGAKDVPWRIGLGDLISWSHPASLTAVIAATSANAKAIVLGVDTGAGQIRCLELNNHERWRINVGARPLGLWRLSSPEPPSNKPPSTPSEYVAVVDSGYMFRIADGGRIVDRHYFGESLRAAARYGDGTILALGRQLHVVPRGEVDRTEAASLPAVIGCLADDGPTPAVACDSSGRTRVFVLR